MKGTAMHRLAVLSLLLVSCDTAKKSDVEGLQQRLDAIAAEQAALEKKVAELAEKPDDTALVEVKAEIAKVQADLMLVQSTLAKPAVPAVPAVRPGCRSATGT